MRHDDRPRIAEKLAREPWENLHDCGCGTGPMISLLHEQDPAQAL